MEANEKKSLGPNEATATANDKLASSSGSRAASPQVAVTSNNHQSGKENQIGEDPTEKFCFKCKRPLSKSRHLINVAGKCQRWHAECFACEICNSPLDKESSCHVYKGQIICREDYSKLQRNCSRCRWPIGASDWVRKAADLVYHLACFTCDICLRQLNTGDQFTIGGQPKEGQARLLCRLHFDVATKNESIERNHMSVGSFERRNSPTSPGHSMDFTLSAFCRRNCSPIGAMNFESSRHHQDKRQQGTDNTGAAYLKNLSRINQYDLSSASPNDGSLMCSSNISTRHQYQETNSQLSVGIQKSNMSATSSNSSPNSAILGSGSSKSKRVRTTFTEDQLSILQTHFQIDSNPDGQDLERIATITGLSKRVTQVWFQNSRARQKKYLIKRKPIGSLGAGSGPTMSLETGDHNHGSSSSFNLQHESAGSTLNSSERFVRFERIVRSDNPQEGGKWTGDSAMMATDDGLVDSEESMSSDEFHVDVSDQSDDSPE